MDQFSIKIDKKLKANLYKICRLCGIDSADMMPILTSDNLEQDDDPIKVHTEPDVNYKIKELIGLMISKDDKMPQTVCLNCVDKINDFYDFREMCYATNIQTSKLLGLKNQIIHQNCNNNNNNSICNAGNPTGINSGLNLKLDFSLSMQTANNSKNRKRKHSDELHEKEDIVLQPLTSNRSSRSPLSLMKKATSVMSMERMLPEQIMNNLETNTQVQQICSICNKCFENLWKLEAHISTCHLPKIERFVCDACNEVLNKGFDIKNHHLWHKLSKTPYKCGLCDQPVSTTYALAKHMRDHNVSKCSKVIVNDRYCTQCQQGFATIFLYNIHTCVVKTKFCSGCNYLLRSEKEYLKHTAHCNLAYVIPSKCILPDFKLIEKEAIENDVDNANEINELLPTGFNCELKEETDFKMGKNDRKTNKNRISKKALKRIDKLLKSTLDALVSIKQEPLISANQSDYSSCSADTTSELNKSCSKNSINGLQHLPPTDGNLNTNHNETDIPDFVKKQNLYNSLANLDSKLAMGSIPILKLKIKKQDGKLNSSLIAVVNENNYVCKTERPLDYYNHEANEEPVQEHNDTIRNMKSDDVKISPSSIDSISSIRTKFGPMDLNSENRSSNSCASEANLVMTSIPMTHLITNSELKHEFDSNEIHNQNVNDIPNFGIYSNSFLTTRQDLQDIKPDLGELDIRNDLQDIKTNMDKLELGLRIINVSAGDRGEQSLLQKTELASYNQLQIDPFNSLEYSNFTDSNDRKEIIVKNEAESEPESELKTNLISDNENHSKEYSNFLPSESTENHCGNSFNLQNLQIKQEPDLHINHIEINNSEPLEYYSESSNQEFNGYANLQIKQEDLHIVDNQIDYSESIKHPALIDENHQSINSPVKYINQHGNDEEANYNYTSINTDELLVDDFRLTTQTEDYGGKHQKSNSSEDLQNGAFNDDAKPNDKNLVTVISNGCSTPEELVDGKEASPVSNTSENICCNRPKDLENQQQESNKLQMTETISNVANDDQTISKTITAAGYAVSPSSPNTLSNTTNNDNVEKSAESSSELFSQKNTTNSEIFSPPLETSTAFEEKNVEVNSLEPLSTLFNSDSRLVNLDFANINEIAENNNNQNIERELRNGEKQRVA